MDRSVCHPLVLPLFPRKMPGNLSKTLYVFLECSFSKMMDDGGTHMAEWMLG